MIGACGLALASSAGCAACTDVQLRRYRDDTLIHRYHYALDERYVEVDGLKLCYQEYGQGETILILPGLGTSIDFWQLNIPALATRYHVVALDVPGFGKSDKPDVPYEIPWLAERVVAFMDAMNLQRVSIIGGSLGGHLALLIALDHPDRVERLVLMGAVGAWPTPGPLLAGGLRLFWSDAVAINHLRANWPSIYDRLSYQQTPLTQTLFRYQMARRADRAAYAPEGRASSRALRNIFFASCRERLGTLRVPVLLVWGREDRIHAPASGLDLRQLIPDSRLVVVPASGHEVMLDQSATFNRLVLAFLEHGSAAIQDTYGSLAALTTGPRRLRVSPVPSDVTARSFSPDKGPADGRVRQKASEQAAGSVRLGGEASRIPSGLAGGRT